MTWDHMDQKSSAMGREARTGALAADSLVALEALLVFFFGFTSFSSSFASLDITSTEVDGLTSSAGWLGGSSKVKSIVKVAVVPSAGAIVGT